MKNGKKVAIAALSILLIVTFSFNKMRHVSHTHNYNELTSQKECHRMTLIIKNRYGIDMNFHYQVVIGGERRITVGNGSPNMFIDPDNRWYNLFYTDIMFVHSEAEAQGFPDNIIVAWPRHQNNFSENLIAGMHWAVDRSEDDLILHGHQIRAVITLEEFGLSYPIEVVDLVDHWESVNRLWGSLDPFEQRKIQNSALFDEPIE